jgi:hypothetical protein
MSAALMVPMVGIKSVISSFSGYYISSKGRYGEVIWLGYGCWTLATGLHCMFTRTTHPVAIAFVLMLEGIGVGCIFQPSKSWQNSIRRDPLLIIVLALIAAQAHSRKEDRALLISTRNFLGSMGGAVGLAIANTIFSNTLQRNLPATLPVTIVSAIRKSIFSAPDLSGLSDFDQNAVLDAYMMAARGVFILWSCCVGTCLLLMVFVKDKGLKRNEDSQEKRVEEVKHHRIAGSSVVVREMEAEGSKAIPQEGIELDSDVESVPKSAAKT